MRMAASTSAWVPAVKGAMLISPCCNNVDTGCCIFGQGALKPAQVHQLNGDSALEPHPKKRFTDGYFKEAPPLMRQRCLYSTNIIRPVPGTTKPPMYQLIPNWRSALHPALQQ